MTRPGWFLPTRRKLATLQTQYDDLRGRYEVLWVHYGVLTGKTPNYDELQFLEVEVETHEKTVEIRRYSPRRQRK